MIIGDSLPPYAVASHTDTWVGQQTDLIDLATRSTITLVLTDSADGDILTVSWGVKSITFTFILTGMDNSGLKLYSRDGATVADWCTSTITDLNRNADLTAVFLVSRVSNDIILTYKDYDATVIACTTDASIVTTVDQNTLISGNTVPNLTSLLRVVSGETILADYRIPYNYMTSWAYFNLRSSFRSVAPFVPTTAAFEYHASNIADLSTAVLPYALSGADAYSATPTELPKTERLTIHGDYIAVRAHELPSAGTYGRLLHPNFTRIVTPTQTNFVYLFCDADIATVTARIVITHINGTTTTIDYTKTALVEGESYAFRSGLPQIYSGDETTVKSYTYTLYRNSGGLTSIGSITYQVDQKCYTDVLTVLVEMPYGGLETLALCGKMTPSVNISKEEAQTSRNQEWTIETGDVTEFGKQTRDEYRIITRLVSSSEYTAYEALLTGELWLIQTGNVLEKVNIGNGKFDFVPRNQAFDIQLKSATVNEV